MAVIKIYAGNSESSMTKLPSPDELKPTYEQVWSENTGRAQSGPDKAKMIGDVVAEKRTYAIKWGILTRIQFDLVQAKLRRGFFYFTVATDTPSSASKYYRSEIAYDVVQAGNEFYYKDVTVSVIEQ